MKSKLRYIFTAVIFLIISFIFASCSSPINGLISNKYEGFEYTVNNNEVTIRYLDNKEQKQDVVIPDEINGMPVTAIADFAIVNLDGVRTITIGKNVKTIGSWSMTNNQSLQEYKVAEGNTNFKAIDGVLFTADLKELCFFPCGKDTEIDKLGKRLSFASFTVPEGVEVIRSKAFYKCYNIKELKLPSTLKVIGEKAFMNCENLESVVLPDGLTSIESDAFSFCTLIDSVTIPESVNFIGDFAFYNCSNVKKFIVEKSESQVSEWGEKWWPVQNGDNLPDLNIEYN